MNKFYTTLLAVMITAATAFSNLNAERMSADELSYLNELRTNAADKLKALVNSP